MRAAAFSRTMQGAERIRRERELALVQDNEPVAQLPSIAEHFGTTTVLDLPNTRPTVKGIVASVGKRHGYTFKEIVGPRRSRALCKVREEAVREAADMRPDMSIMSLSKIFQRDHTSLLYLLKKTRQPGAAR